MKNTFIKIRTDRSLQVGLILLTLSVLLYSTTYALKDQYNNPLTRLFFIHYGLALGYFIYLGFQKQLRLLSLFGKASMPYHIILLQLFNVSAYSLNRTLPVFHNSVEWLTIFLIVENSLLIFYVIISDWNKAFASVLLFFLIPALFFNGYQLLMVLPYLAIGIMASPFLGISLHVLVPVFYVIALLRIIRRLTESGADWKPIATGISCCLIILAVYVMEFHSVNSKIVQVHHRMLIPGAGSELPEWVRLAQALPDNSFTEKALKSGLVYQELREWDSFLGFGFRSENTRFHDPLVLIASFINGKIELDATTRIKILNAMYNMRHENADRFWSGLNLKTSNVVTNVQLYPAYRLSYTEMILNINNDSYARRTSWFNQQEALYTFQLPEGATVSSLSLWIEGIEAKARLTTKGKAAKAYNTIVGREARDPSVVYWMEGNKIRVRIFPCTPNEDRQFKIGVTAPLAYRNGKLIYSNISFRGPDFEDAHSSVNILLQGAGARPDAHFSLEKNGNAYCWAGAYMPDWTVSTKATPLNETPFYFNGSSYRIQEMPLTYDNFQPDYIYLDLHKGWHTKDITGLSELFPGKEFYAYNYYTGNMELLRAEEILAAMDDKKLPQFSLFPFHKIQHPNQSLVITKGNKATPNLSDVRETSFSKGLFNRLSGVNAIKVFDLHTSPSGYMQSLKEFKVLQYASGSLDKLKAFLTSKRFPAGIVTEEALEIRPAGMMILKSQKTGEPSNAPDHLLRLFAYHQVLKKIGKNYFKEDYLNNEVIEIASAANVVTPISSLIVLETLDDYARFDIEENKDSLGNASIESSGAVPEPHEWALIIMGSLVVALLCFLKRRKALSAVR